MEAELEAEQRRHREASGAARKFERQLKEFMVSSEEDRRQVIDLTEQVAMLNQKIKVYKRQVEEAVSIANDRSSHWIRSSRWTRSSRLAHQTRRACEYFIDGGGFYSIHFKYLLFTNCYEM